MYIYILVRMSVLFGYQLYLRPRKNPNNVLSKDNEIRNIAVFLENNE